MEQNTRHNREHLQRNITRSEEEEEHSETRPRQTNTTKETKDQRRFKRTITHITNLSKHKLTPGETSLLWKGLNFIPTPKKEHPAKTTTTYTTIWQKIKTKVFFFTMIQPIHNQLNRMIQHYTQVLDGHHLQDKTPF